MFRRRRDMFVRGVYGPYGIVVWPGFPAKEKEERKQRKKYWYRLIALAHFTVSVGFSLSSLRIFCCCCVLALPRACCVCASLLGYRMPAVRAGWEMQATDQGVPYYVDHINKRTSWDPPLMSTGGMSVIASQLPDIREQRMLFGGRRRGKGHV